MFEVYGTIAYREGGMFKKDITKLLGRFTYHKDAVRFSKTCYKKYKAFKTEIRKIK